MPALGGAILVLWAFCGVGPAQAAGEPEASSSPSIEAPASPAIPPPAAGKSRIVVTSTMLGTALAELASDLVEVVTLIPAQGCPGHYDITPKALADVAAARATFVHGYQRHLGDRLGGNGGRPVHYIAAGGAQTLAGPYLGLCAELAAALIELFPAEKDTLQSRLVRLEEDVRAASARQQERAMAAVRDRPLCVARYQKEFVTWAGARPAVLFDRAEETSLKEVDALVGRARGAGVRGVVGNLQWGDREARAFAGELDVPFVILSNYPESSEPGAWLRLLRDNVDRLVSLSGDE